MEEVLRWEYHLVWRPSKQGDVYEVWATASNGTRYLWEQWKDLPTSKHPTAQQVHDALWSGTLQLLERHTHIG